MLRTMSHHLVVQRCIAISPIALRRMAVRTIVTPTPFTPCTCASARSIHTTSTLSIVGGGRRGGSRSSVKMSVAARAAAEQKQREADRLAHLRAIEKHEADLETAASQVASEGGQYRRPHVKRTGRSVQLRKAELAKAEAEEEEKNEMHDLDAMEAALTPEERKKFEELMKGGTIETDRQDDSAAESTPKSRREAARRRAQEAEAQVKSKLDGEPDASDALPEPLVAHVTEQLRRLDQSTPSSSRSGGGGIGFDSIDLSRSSIFEDEVFEDVAMSAGMRKLHEGARKGDSAKRQMVQRIERVTEKTKEIVGRVLLEESIKIANVNPQASRPTPPHASAAASAVAPQLIDLRSTPTFRIHQVRYSTDLAWASIMWTLGKEGYEAAEDPAEIISTPHLSKRKSNRPNRSSSVVPLPHWFETRRRVAATLEHVLKSLRFTLGRELDLKYTPSLKFTYDDLYHAKIAKEMAEREKLKEEQENTRRMLEQLAEETKEDGEEDATNPQNALALQKQRLRRGAEAFDADAWNSKEELALDAAADAQYDAERHYFLPKRKIAALVQREKAKMKFRDAKKKQKLLLAEARALAHGVSSGSRAEAAPPPPPETTDPTVLREYLKGEMARLVREKNPGRKENITLLTQTRAQLTQLQQIQALARKSLINPVEVLKQERHQAERPQYPKGWRKMKDQFWKTTDGRTRSKQ